MVMPEVCLRALVTHPDLSESAGHALEIRWFTARVRNGSWCCYQCYDGAVDNPEMREPVSPITQLKEAIILSLSNGVS
jgi:hypothetical protein